MISALYASPCFLNKKVRKSAFFGFFGESRTRLSLAKGGSRSKKNPKQQYYTTDHIRFFCEVMTTPLSHTSACCLSSCVALQCVESDVDSLAASLLLMSYCCYSHINSHNQVRGHRTGSSHSGAEEYPREKHKQTKGGTRIYHS